MKLRHHDQGGDDENGNGDTGDYESDELSEFETFSDMQSDDDEGNFF